MSPTDPGSSPVNLPRNEDLFVLLIKRADALEGSVRRAERKLKDKIAFRADLGLALVVVGLILTLALAISPYLGLAHLDVPQIISYVSAFAVLLFVYLLYVAYGNAATAHELQRATRHAHEDGSVVLSQALCTLETSRKESSTHPESRARLESALSETEQANMRLRNLETQPRKDIEEVVEPHVGHRSSALAGIIGGACGAAIGMAVATSPGAIAVAGPLGAVIGVAFAVLVWRGPAHWKVERAIERTQEALGLYYKELNRPSTDAPQDIRDHLWERYDKLMSSYATVAEAAVGARSARAEQTPARGRAIENQVLVEVPSA